MYFCACSVYVCLSVCSTYVRLCVREIGYIAKISVKRVSVMVYTYNVCVCVCVGVGVYT